VLTANLSVDLLEIRQLSTLSEFADVVRLQREIWGFEDVELLPQRLFVVASKIGGQVLGAFDNGTMVAFCLCIPGLKAGGSRQYFHSHMLGVLPAYRNSGLGRRMKLEQRKYALAAGIELIEWTFDPFELKNAFFNIERLGAIVRRYVHNQYGTTTSKLHGGLPTDRLVPEWWIQCPRVEELLSGGPLLKPPIEGRIELPSNIREIRADHPEEALRIQEDLGTQFDEHFRADLAVVAFERSEQTCAYLLGKWQSL
jgi:predicted GNAT superfamily acetyltransferase